jgi:hypothetical protein
VSVTNQNYIHEEIKSGLNLGNASTHSVQNLVSHLLSKRTNFEIYKTVLSYVCETCALTLRGQHRLGVFEDRVLGRIFEPKREELTRSWGKFNLYSSPSILG